ncbi:MAG: hypothetical protein ACLFSL_04605 [Candidatus Woesearchaeota archaeon]
MNLSSGKDFDRIICGNHSKSYCARTSFFSSKRSQKDASSASNLIALLGLLMILYILFVPPAEREELLEGDQSSSGSDDSQDGRLETVLLEENPGKLVRSPEEDFEYSLPSFTLKESTYSSVLAEENPFIVDRSWFSDSSEKIEFTMPSVKDAVKVLLTFDVGPEPEGDLKISLNGDEIFMASLDEGPIDPITLPEEQLRGNNTLTLTSSLPGFSFWSSTTYRIRGLSIAGKFYEPEDLESSHKFFLDDEVLDNIDSTRLTFSPTCNKETVGQLSINMNGQSIFSSIPDCNTLNRVNFNPELLEKENTISFISAEGDYTISLGEITASLGDVDNPRYSFHLSEEDHESLKSGDRAMKLSLELQDDESFKEAYVLVNSVKYFLNTRENGFSRTIRHEVLREGRNTVEIQPLNDFEAIGLEAAIYNE